MKSSIEVADIFRAHGRAYRQAHGHQMPLRHLRAMGAIETCRTSELGGHVDQCDHCGRLRISYNSCRNRHCPKCQSLNKERWLEARKRDLLPIRYFHLVFTIPEKLRPLALRNQKVIYTILFESVRETLKELGKNPKHLGAQIGFIAVLHTWSQTLIDHPHLHCIVTGGGLSLDGKRWISSKKRFFIPVKVAACLFRGKFVDQLRKAYGSGKLEFPGKIEHLEGGFNGLLTDLYHQNWVVFCKPPFSRAHHVIDYLGRYTHRVALTNDRIRAFNQNQVTIRFRDSTEGNTIKLMTLEAFEFIRRFLLHILPDQFVKIRHYGILSNRNRKTKLLRCKQLLGALINEDEDKPSWQEMLIRIAGIDPAICPYCGKGKMILKEILLPQPGGCPP